MDTEKKKAIEAAREFCEGVKSEKELREAIAYIMGKLNRSNLSAVDGERLAKSLLDAYGCLKKLE